MLKRSSKAVGRCRALFGQTLALHLELFPPPLPYFYDRGPVGHKNGEDGALITC